MNAKERIGQWAAVEGERLEDMLAEARAKVETDKPDAVTNGAAHEAPTATGEA